jgi:hypothetical protein
MSPAFVPLAVALSSAEVIALVALLIAVASAAVSVWQARITVASESWGLQPVVVVYESHGMQDDPKRAEPLSAEVFLLNDGPGTAFNVEFGIEVGDYRRVYRPRESTLNRKGDFPRVIRGGGRAPEDEAESYAIEVPTDLGSRIDRRVYWCEFDDALKRSWRTCNWWDATRGLTIDSLSKRQRRRSRERTRPPA